MDPKALRSHLYNSHRFKIHYLDSITDEMAKKRHQADHSAQGEPLVMVPHRHAEAVEVTGEVL